MARRQLVAVAAAGALWLASFSAGAEPGPLSVRLTIHDCDPPLLSTIDVYTAIALELDAGGVERVTLSASPGPVDAELDLTLRCGSRLTARMVLVTPSNGRETIRNLRIDDIRRGDRARAISLMAAEFVRREWPSLIEAGRARLDAAPQAAGAQPKPAAKADSVASADAPVPAAPAPSAVAVAPPPTAIERTPAAAEEGPIEPRPPPRASALELAASGEARWFTSYDSWLWGGNVGLSSGRICARVEALAAARSTRLGTASFAIVSAGGGIRLWQSEVPRFRWAIGVGASLGTAWATGHADHAGVSVTDKTTFYADARLVTEAAVLLGSTRVLASLEAGRATGMAAFAGDEIAGATGGWLLGATLGVGLMP